MNGHISNKLMIVQVSSLRWLFKINMKMQYHMLELYNHSFFSRPSLISGTNRKSCTYVTSYAYHTVVKISLNLRFFKNFKNINQCTLYQHASSKVPILLVNFLKQDINLEEIYSILICYFLLVQIFLVYIFV